MTKRDGTTGNYGKWDFQEAGWYIHPTYGGVCLETSETIRSHGGTGAGWYYWPKHNNKALGPYKTMAEAMAIGEKRRGH